LDVCGLHSYLARGDLAILARVARVGQQCDATARGQSGAQEVDALRHQLKTQECHSCRIAARLGERLRDTSRDGIAAVAKDDRDVALYLNDRRRDPGLSHDKTDAQLL